MSLAFVHRFRRVDYQATIYGTDIIGLGKSLQARATGTRRMFEYPTRLIAISDFTRSLLLEQCPRIDENRVEVAPLGVSPFWFEEADPCDVNRAYGIPSDHQVLLTVSRLDSRKGHRAILQAIPKLPESLRKKLTYAIVGEATDLAYKRELERLAGGSGCNVQLLGNVGDVEVRSLFARASLFCMPGEVNPRKVEGFGLVYLEAAAQGLPSLASSVGAVSEVVLDGQTGWMVPPSDSTAVVGALTKLLDDRQLLQTVGQAAKARAATFTWERCARLTYGEAA
jgi:glycosyltransferase involved in cell wall biosynthesis